MLLTQVSKAGYAYAIGYCFFNAFSVLMLLLGNKHETDLCIFELLGKCPCVAMEKHNTTINICMSVFYIVT
jgi:hypothetical protein